MANDVLHKGTAAFETEGRLLQELGERLVSRADVALVELIKNAYDADASLCRVSRTHDAVIIVDDGHGITQREFLDKWMRIATGGKQKERLSPRYQRVMTGAKGIGRFAVRFLGGHLGLVSVADDPIRKCLTKLTATFNWPEIDRATDLRQAPVPYLVARAAEGDSPGTTLTISSLRDPEKMDFGKGLRNEVLGIVSPISGLDPGPFQRSTDSRRDPGFTLELPADGDEAPDLNLAATVLAHCYARVLIEHHDSRVAYTITHKDGRQLLKREFSFKSHLSRGLHADIRYFPRRSRMFQGIEVSGWDAWGWVKKSRGVGVVDHGFRIRPYGFEDDDWLNLELDLAHNRRDWRTKLMDKYYPLPKLVVDTTKEKASPMLYLPSFHQLVGAVFVESVQAEALERPVDLTPAADREGYIENEGYHDLHEIVRTGMELLALADHTEVRRLEEERAKQAAKELRSDFKAAIQHIRTLPSLTEEDRSRLITQYATLAKELEEVDDYHREASQRMETMASLGVLAGFMTHEATRLISGLDRAANHLERVSHTDPYVAKLLPDIRNTLEEFKGQIDYSSMFISSLQDKETAVGPIPVAAQVQLVVERFRVFAERRSVEVDVDVQEGLRGPSIPVTAYSGILLNLYTNALKAVVGSSTSDRGRHVAVKAWREPKWHILEVADTGPGIPPQLRKRIWDPLFTTTSGGSSNPLGSGMGLGLSLIKEIASKFRGAVELVDPPPGYSTCFRVRLPNT
ncbi:MAG: sensor histidine kinase [Syntrophorhabdales bacterium]